MIRFRKKTNIFNVAFTGLSAMLSVGIVLYGVGHFGISVAWAEIVLNVFYIACIVMMWLYFFKCIDRNRFNYWTSMCLGMTILLRDIIFAPPLMNIALNKICLALAVYELLLLTFFYARKKWETYRKSDLWLILIVDVVIALLYNYDSFLESKPENALYIMTEIWIRPTITYGLVACFVTETKSKK